MIKFRNSLNGRVRYPKGEVPFPLDLDYFSPANAKGANL